MPEPITIEALEAIGFSVNRDRDGDTVFVYASLRINDDLEICFYDGALRLSGLDDDLYEFPDDMSYLHLAMQLFQLSKREPEIVESDSPPPPLPLPLPQEEPAVHATPGPRGVGRPKKTPGDLKAVDLRIPVTESQHAVVKAAAGDMGIAEWSRRILIAEAQKRRA